MSRHPTPISLCKGLVISCTDVILIYRQPSVPGRFHSGELQYDMSNISSHRTHSASGKVSHSKQRFGQKDTAIWHCNQHVRRRWGIISRTRLSGCWHGYTRNSFCKNVTYESQYPDTGPCDVLSYMLAFVSSFVPLSSSVSTALRGKSH